MDHRKIKVLILGSDDFFTARSIRNVLNNGNLEVRGLIISSPTLGQSNIFGTIVRLYRRSGSHYVLFQILQKGLRPVLLRLARECDILLPSKLLKQTGTCVYRSKSLSGQALYELVSQITPGLIVSSRFTKIIGPEKLRIPRYGCINIHKSNLPSYRGIAPLFSALKNEEKKEVGVTAHLMDEGIHTGLVLVQQRIPIEKDHTVFSLTIKCAKIASSLVENAVEGLIAGKITPVSQLSKGSYYPWPAKRDVREFSIDNKFFWHWKDLRRIRWLRD